MAKREHHLTIYFKDEDGKREALTALRQVAGEMGLDQGEAVKRFFQLVPLLIQEIEALSDQITTPSLTFTIAKQLPLWRQIEDTIKELKK